MFCLWYINVSTFFDALIINLKLKNETARIPTILTHINSRQQPTIQRTMLPNPQAPANRTSLRRWLRMLHAFQCIKKVAHPEFTEAAA
jgi:hypothetical protein